MERQRAPPKGREAKNGSRGIDSRGRIPERLCRCNGRYAQKKEQRRQREQAKKARRWYFIKQKACGLAMLAITVLAVWATEGDISVTLCWDNLEALCQDCHNKEHHKQERHKRYQFDENGGILPPYQKNN